MARDSNYLTHLLEERARVSALLALLESGERYDADERLNADWTEFTRKHLASLQAEIETEKAR